MTNNELLNAVQNSNGAILALENKTLSLPHAYKVIKLRKTLKSAFDKFLADEQALLEEVGVSDASAFDARQKELQEKDKLTKEEKSELEEMNAKIQRYIGLRRELLAESIDLSEIKAMPYDEWFRLKAENPSITIDIEDALMGIAWSEPEE